MNSVNYIPSSDYISKIDTIEGKSFYLITHFDRHPTDQKTSFNFGTIMLLNEGDKKISLYESELISNDCLNQKSEWNSDYFSRLRFAVSMSRPEFRYSFIDVQEELSYKMLKISEVLKKEKSNAEISLINIKMRLTPTNDIISNLFNFLIISNKRKNQQLRELEVKLEKEKKEKFDLAKELETNAKSRQNFEEEIFEKFALILNEKKKKIKSLKSNTDRLLSEKIPQSQLETKKSQLDLDTSQIGIGIKSSLFEPTLNFRPNLKNKVPIIRLDVNNNNENNNYDAHLELDGAEEEKETKNIERKSNSVNKQSSLSDLLGE